MHVRRQDVQVGRQQFSELAGGGGRLHVDNLPREVLDELSAHGVDQAALAQVAGDDRVISGDEFNALYDALARPDGNGRPRRAISESLFRDLSARVELGEPQAADWNAPSSTSGRARTTGINARPARAADDPTPADEETPTEEPAEPRAEPLGWDERNRRVGDQNVLTHTEVDPEILRTAQAIATLPPSEERGHTRVQAYLDAITARDEAARLTAAGDRRGAAAVRKPAGVPDSVWNLTAALSRQGISANDVAHYLATGALPDLHDQNGEVVMTGEQRMQALERAAVQEGSWTAVNSFTFLVGMRRSAMAAERGAALAAQTGPEIEAAIAESQALDTELRRGLQSIYRSATLARERTGRGLIDRAARLDRDAQTARARGDGERATRLEAEAQRLRDRGADITFREAEYRASMRSYRADAGRLYRSSAEAQITTGELQIRRMVASTGALPEAPPVILGNDDGTNTGNGVPGAGRLLSDARTVDPNASRDDGQLALEGRRSGALAVFHRAHLDRGGYHARVPAQGALPAARSDALVAHRSAYLDARVDQARIATERIDLLETSPANAGRDLRLAALEAERRGVADELASALGQSMASERRLTEDRERADTLAQQSTDAATQLSDARTAASDASQGVSRAHDQADAVFGDTFKTSGEARRDREGISDAQAVRSIDEGRLRVAEVNQTDTDRAARAANAALRRSEVQANRDLQDAELVTAAMQSFPSTSAICEVGPHSVCDAYHRAREMADHAAGREVAALDRAEASPPRRRADRERAQLAIAERRVDLSRYYTRSAEGQVVALGEAGRAGATDRLDTAASLVDRADRTSTTLPSGSDQRAHLASEVVTARSELALANADYRPAVTRDQLASAELVADTELSDRFDLAGAAYGQIGRSATISLARIDQRFDAILESGHYTPDAADTLYRQAHRMFDEPASLTSSYYDLTSGAERGHLVPDTQETREARELLGRFDRALDTVDDMLHASTGQIRRGQAYAEARTRQLAHAEIQAAQAQVSSVISGGAWLLSFGQFDMKEEMAEAGEHAMSHRLMWIRHEGDGLTRGAQDMASSWSAARDQGRAFEWLSAVRIFSDPTRRDSMPETYLQAFQTIDSLLAQPVSRQADWQDFNRVAIREGHVPVARALAGPTLALEEAHRSLGDERIMAITPNMQDMIQSQADSLKETTDGMMWIIGINTALEVGLGLVLTGGVGSGASLANAGRTVNSVRGAAQAVNSARNATLALRALSMARTAGTVTVVGGGMLAANYGVGRLVGRNTGVARGFEVLTNFIPIGAGQRAAGIGRAAEGAANAADDVARAGSRLQALRRAMSWSHVREASAWNRALTPVALGSAQAFATTIATPHVARWIGLERSELGQAAVGLGLNVLFATGMAGAAGGRSRSAAMADHLLRVTGDGEAVNGRVRDQVRAEIDTFARNTEGRVPTEADVATLRSRLYDRLGLTEGSPDVPERRALVDGAIEAMRIDRATQLGVREAGFDAQRTPEAARRAVENAGERLFAARGGEEGGASRLQAYRDAAMAMSERFGADAQGAFASRDTARGNATMEARAVIGERAAAAEIVDAVALGVPEGGSLRNPETRARAEAIVAEELTAARHVVDGTDGAGLGVRDGSSSFYDRLARRLVDEGRLTPAEVETIVGAARNELVNQAVVRHLAAEQAIAGERPLTRAEVDRVATDLARRAGLPDAPAFARSIQEHRSQFESAGILRPLPADSAQPLDAAAIRRRADEAAAANPSIRRFIEDHGPPARQLVGELGAEGFMRAFGDGEVVSFDARQLMDLGPARTSELGQIARERPQDVQRLLQGMSTESRGLIQRAAREIGIDHAIRLAEVASESPQGLAYLRSADGGEARVLERLRTDSGALAAEARRMEARIFMRASDGTFLLRGEPQPETPPPTRAELDGLARRAGVDPRVLDNPTAHPREMARLMAQMRSEMSTAARQTLDTEIQGRRFVDDVHFEEARQAGVENPEHRYGRRDFEAWQRAEGIVMERARRGEPLTMEVLLDAHRAATEGILAPERRGRIRSAPLDTVHQGGEGPLGQQLVSNAEFQALRSNPDLTVHDLGAAGDGQRRVIVEYLRPQEVRARLEGMLSRVDERLRAGEDPVTVAADAQREFVSIHPFLDGNGRMSRLVMDYVLARGGVDPSVVRDPNLDTAISREAWRAEVRDGLRRPFDATVRAWSAHLRGVAPREGGSGAVSAAPDSPYTRRNTLGWTGEPTRSPPAGAEHLGVIRAGMDRMHPRARERIDRLLARAEEGAPHLVAERDALAARQIELSTGENGRILFADDARLSDAERARKTELAGEFERIQGRRADVDRQIEQSQREARQAAVAEMELFRNHLMRRGVGESAARARAAELDVTGPAAGRASEAELRSWAADFFRLVRRDINPGAIQLVHNAVRANAARGGSLNVGDAPTRGLMFHELGHYVEFSDPALARAARAWVIARSEHANGGTAQTRSMRELSGSDYYRADERAFEDHFENPYVGRDYGADPSTEVVSVGLEHLTSADRMLHLYQRDPEHFFFVLGVLER